MRQSRAEFLCLLLAHVLKKITFVIVSHKGCMETEAGPETSPHFSSSIRGPLFFLFFFFYIRELLPLNLRAYSLAKGHITCCG